LATPVSVARLPGEKPVRSAARLCEELERGGRFRSGDGSAITGVKHYAAGRDVERRIEGDQPAVRLLLPADVRRTRDYVTVLAGP